jgi:MoxR-like ATPases
MEEQQVSLDNSTRLLPRPFFVLATQNALDQAGTYPCRSRSWTASCSASAWAIRIWIPNWSFWAAARLPAGRFCPRP